MEDILLLKKLLNKRAIYHVEKYFNDKYLSGDILVCDDFIEEKISLWYEEACNKLFSDGTKFV